MPIILSIIKIFYLKKRKGRLRGPTKVKKVIGASSPKRRRVNSTIQHCQFITKLSSGHNYIAQGFLSENGFFKSQIKKLIEIIIFLSSQRFFLLYFRPRYFYLLGTNHYRPHFDFGWLQLAYYISFVR